MDTPKKIAVGALGAVVVLGAAFLFMQGDGEPGEPAEDTGSQAGANDCQTSGFDQAQGEWGGVTCQSASGAATFSDTFTCGTADQSAVGGTLQNATAGSLDLTVEDAAGTTVFEDTYEAGTHPISDFIGQGETGEWTVHVVLSEDWSSDDFGVGAGCMNSDGGGGGSGDTSSSQACDTTSNRETTGTSFGQIRCTDKEGEDTFEATFQCGDPSQGNVGWEPDMDAGTVTVTVLDADGQTVVEETFSGSNRGGVPLEDGTTGEWTVRTELSSDFAGSFYTQASCRTE